MSYYVASNRLVYEAWEDREYNVHLKKLEQAKRHARLDNSEPTRFPHLSHKPKDEQVKLDRDYGVELENKSLGNRLDKIKFGKGFTDNWNFEYEKHKNVLSSMRFVLRDKDLSKLEKENLKIAKRIENAKGAYNNKKWERQFAEHERIMHLRQNKFYTPRGVGYRNAISLPTSKRELTRSKQKSIMVALNEAVNKFERADIVFLKTLIVIDHKDCLRLKKEFEAKYNIDLRKGLLKVLEREFEPFINALLIDNNEVESDRIYESLYEPIDAAIIVSEALLLRNQGDREDLLRIFESKMDSSLTDEIVGKIDGDLRQLLLALVENQNLDSTDDSYLETVDSDVHTLIKHASSATDILSDIIRASSKIHMKAMFNLFRSKTDSDLYQKVNSSKAFAKCIKSIQMCIMDPYSCYANKLQKMLKIDKSEFIRLFMLFEQDQLEAVMTAYLHEFNVNLETDIKQNFKDNLIRYFMKRIHRNDGHLTNKLYV